MVLGKRGANLTIEQGRGSCEREPHPDGTNYHPYQTLLHTQFLLPTVSQTLSCENTYSPASAHLTYAEQRRHETAGRNFFPRPAAFLADTLCQWHYVFKKAPSIGPPLCCGPLFIRRGFMPPLPGMAGHASARR